MAEARHPGSASWPCRRSSRGERIPGLSRRRPPRCLRPLASGTACSVLVNNDLHWPESELGGPDAHPVVLDVARTLLVLALGLVLKHPPELTLGHTLLDRLAIRVDVAVVLPVVDVGRRLSKIRPTFATRPLRSARRRSLARRSPRAGQVAACRSERRRGSASQSVSTRGRAGP